MTSATARWLLAASPHAAQGLVAAFTIATGALLVRARRGSVAPGGAPLGRAHELLLLALVLTAALLTRVLWPRSMLTVPYWFSETMPVYVARALELGNPWAQWTRLLNAYQVYWVQESATVMPVAVVFQFVFGPSFHLPLLMGAFYGVAAVLLAWALGRMAHSPTFGLLFASLVAVAPLQIVWSRHGGLYIASVTHVLLAMFLGFVAGRRRSALLAALAAVCVWASLYNYSAARVAIPLGLAALGAGMQQARASRGEALRVLLASFATLAIIYVWARPPGIMAILWPVYTGYVGNKGERDLAELVGSNAAPVAREIGRTLNCYFLSERAGRVPPVWFRWEAESGGLCLAPVALLGLLGLAVVLRRLRREWLWLMLAGLGFLVPVLSMSSARRLLVLDVGWCALAAHGLCAVLDWRPLRATRPATNVLVASALVVLGCWSFATVAVLNGAAGERHRQSIPFGESGFNDGLTCKRCLRAGWDWQAEIAQERFVVLFDNDLEREALAIPGGLPLYGQLAALSAGRPGNFVAFYDAVANFTWEPPRRGGVFYDGTRADFASYLFAQLDAARPATVVWHFERPTRWERWVIGRLEQAGGTVSAFATPLSASPGAQVRTPWPLSPGVRAVVEDLVKPVRTPGRCPGLRQVEGHGLGFDPLHLAASGSTDDAGLPDWLVGSWFRVRYRGATFDATLPVASRDGIFYRDFLAGSDVEHLDGGGARVHLVTRAGKYLAYDVEAGTGSEPTPLLARGAGLDCAVRIGTHWWTVDPTSGELSTTDPGGAWVPKASWTGIGTDGHGRLVLASADQWLGVYDLGQRVEVRRFPAAVWPSLRYTTDECAPVLAGDGWYGTFSNLTSVLTVYDAEGTELGVRRLDRFLVLENFAMDNRITAIAAQGRFLGVGIGYEGLLKTIELKLGAACTDG
jgi:hypothetical protein